MPSKYQELLEQLKETKEISHNFAKKYVYKEEIEVTHRRKMKKDGYNNEDKKLKEEAPSNAVGSGAIAGVGVGPDGEPGFTPKIIKRYKDKKKKSAGIGFKEFRRQAKAIGIEES